MMAATDRLSHALNAAVEAGVFPGAVLLVCKDGFAVYEHAVGCAMVVPHRETASIDTLYDLASLTKPLATATALLVLVQEQRIALEDRLAQYFPELAKCPVGEATLAHVLSHRAGLPGWRPIYEWLGTAPQAPRKDASVTAEVIARIGSEPLESPVGARAIYSDLGFMLLGLLIERVARMPLDAYCEHTLYRPMGAAPLRFCRVGGSTEGPPAPYAATEDDPWRGRVLRGEVHDENAYALGGVAGHAGLFGTARGIATVAEQWLRAWHGEASCLSPVWVRRFTARPPHADDGSWALGWDTPSASSTSGRFFSSSSFGHLGFTGTSIWVDPLVRLVVVLLSNRVHPSRQNEGIRQFRPSIHDLVYDITIREGNKDGSR